MGNRIDLIFGAKNAGSVSKEINKVTKALRGTNGTVVIAQKRIQKLNHYFQNTTRDSNRASGGIVKFNKNLGSMNQLLSYAKIIAVGRALAFFTQGAIEAIEQTNLFNVALGKMAEEADEYIQTMNQNYGFDVINMRTAVGTFNLLARSMGMSAEQATILSTNTNKLAYDLSSLTNIPIDQVMKDLRSGLVGQSETVYKYGIDVTEASLKTEAMINGVAKSVRNMSQGEKMALRYMTMIRQTGLAQGDFARTIDTPANQLKILSERFVTLSRSIGSMFIPMLAKVLPFLNAVVILLTRVFNRLALLFGFEAPKISEDIGNQSFGTLGDDADGATNAINGTTKALDKLKNHTMGFDELNVIQETPDTASGGGAGTGAIAGGMDLGFLDGYDNLMDTVNSKVDGIVKKLEKFAPLIGGIASALAVLGLGKLVGHLKAMAPALGLTSTILGTFKKFIGLTAIFTGLFIAIKGFKDILDTSKPTFEQFNNTLLGLELLAIGLAIVFSPVVGGIALAVGAIALLGVYVYKYWDDIKAWTVETWESVKEKISTTITNVKEAIITGFTTAVEFLAGLPDKIAYWLGFALGSIVKWAIGVAEYVKKKIPEIIESITTFFKELPDKIKTAISNLKDKIEAWAKDVKQWFKEVLPAILESISIKMATLPMEIYVAIKGLRAKINEIGKLILDGIFEGLAGIKEKIKGWKDSFVKGFKDALGIKSPSTVFRDEVGLNMGLGIAEGIDASRSDIVGTATSIANDVQKVFDGIRYNADVDYSLEIQKAVKSGDYALANQLEQQRNAKIQGEGMGYELTFDYEQFSTPIVEGIGETTVAVNQSTTDLMISATRNMTEQLTNENRVIADLKVHLSNLQATLFGRLQSWFSQTISAINSIRINITYVSNNYSSTSKDIKKRATGGFPEMGEMFIANENGAEMIGSVGNRTAVVNNDQIVEAVSTGVARAVQSVMGNREEQPITITLDGEVIYKNQQKISQNRGINFGMGRFAR